MLYKTIYYNESQATANLNKDFNSFSFADQIQINFFSFKKNIVLISLVAIRLIIILKYP